MDWIRFGPVSALLGCVLGSQAIAQTVYVSPRGDDGSPGTAGLPLATLERARDAVRKLGPGATVWLEGGLYVEPHGLKLTAADSGAAGKPIVWRGVEGQQARIFGGAQLDAAKFKAVTDAKTLARLRPEARGKVVALRLDGGVAALDKYADYFKGNGGLFQLIVDGHIQPLSRWPAEGYTTMAGVLDSGLAPKPHAGTFKYRPEIAEHAAAWSAAAAEGRLWLTGFWRVPFEVYTLRVANVDTKAQTIEFAAAGPGGIGSKYSDTVNGTRIGNGKENFYVTNLLEEIARPGQWSYDFGTRTVYLWPPETGVHEVLLANLSDPAVKLDGAHDVTLRNLIVEGGLTQAVLIANGKDDQLVGSVVRNAGGGGIDVEGGSGDVIKDNDLYHLGSYGVRLVAGDRKTLTPGAAVAENNHIYSFGEQERITEGIYLDGVGNRAVHNLIHDGPYHGINYQGNDQYMAYNEIHHIGLDAGDLGIFYTNGDWAAQGNVIEYNLGHDSPNANGSYIDDGASGRTTRNNIFYKISAGIFLGGGHNNVIENNVIIDCHTGIHADNRGVARKYDSTANHLTRFLRTMDPKSASWQEKYGDFLTSILADPTQPTGNRFADNILVDDPVPYQLNDPVKVDAAANPVVGDPAGFADAAKLDFHLAAGSAVLRADPRFKAIPVDSIGLYRDEFRKTLPTDAETGRTGTRKSIQFFDSNVDVKASDKIKP